MHSHDEVIEKLSDREDEIFIIGGEKIYNLFIDDVDKMLITEVEESYDDADAYFPDFDKEEFDKEFLYRVEDESIKYNHVKYLRKTLKK